MDSINYAIKRFYTILMEYGRTMFSVVNEELTPIEEPKKELTPILDIIDVGGPKNDIYAQWNPEYHTQWSPSSRQEERNHFINVETRTLCDSSSHYRHEWYCRTYDLVSDRTKTLYNRRQTGLAYPDTGVARV